MATAREIVSEVDDIVVLGSGPAALAMAAACSARGAPITLVAPSPRAPWAPNYCLWEDELPDPMQTLVEHRWPEAVVHTPSGAYPLARAYVKLGTAELQRHYWAQVESSIRVLDARVGSVSADGEHTMIETDARTIRARVVVDATGANSRFVRRVHSRPPAYQIAYGLLLDAPSHPFDPATAVLMDFRPADADAPEPPSFLYVLPLEDGRLFVEETVLAGRPAPPLDLLQTRLERRLDALGLAGCKRLDEERCRIAMGLGLPLRRQTVVPFGAAAAMVHPASGYLQARVFRKAPEVADAIVDALGRGSARAAADLANDALWPRSDRVAWELYAVGLELLVRMGVDHTARFFDSFFELPRESWSGFLRGTLPPSELLTVMLQLLSNLPSVLRWELIRSSVTGGAAPLARSLVPMGVS